MLTVPIKYVNLLNIALIFLTCVLAHIFPYHLLIFSYAVLGPAHYLTQISWLHDRRYFANSSLLAPAMGLFSLFLMIPFSFAGVGPLAFSAIILSAALWLAIIVTLPASQVMLRGATVIAGVPLIWCVIHFPSISLFIATLLPTVLHVFVFTAAFMWMGAVKSQKKSAYISVLALLVCAGTFLIPTATCDIAPHLEGIKFFQPVINSLQQIGFSNSTETQLFGFLSYAYTYHYLNWFSKAEVIHWDRIPRERMHVIILIYLIALSIYAYNFTAGFLIILLLSYMHVLLEFPLNVRTIVAIGQGRT